MALHYLYNKGGNVLVIMPNSLYKYSHNEQYGQFLGDWFEKLPFDRMGYKYGERIFACNNHNSNISKMNDKDYGLIIIDEAHEFLNDDTYRYEELKSLKADKVAFLTATPIKNDTEDLEKYVEIGEKIKFGEYVSSKSKDINRAWISKIIEGNLEKEDVICSSFDVTSPVTRYFKDTVTSLSYKDKEITKARRLLADIWEFEGTQNKNEVLLEQINKCYNDNPKDNKFVIFTQYVSKEAKDIAKYLEEESDFSNFDEVTDVKKTYKVITGENSYELNKFSREENLPTVLIVTFQIAEQGVNLPGFNYVINYHIHGTPSKLEQRFGRIDRMGGKSDTQIEKKYIFVF